MSTLDLFRRAPYESADRIAVAIENDVLSGEVNFQGAQIRELQEDLLRVSDAFDNIGWAPLSLAEVHEIPLRTVKQVAKVSRSMYAMNPFIKRGIEARISYVWGKGLTFDGVDDLSQQIQNNRKRVFSPQAYAEFERALATDGNAFTALPLDTPSNRKTLQQIFRVRFEEITNAVSNPYDREDIWFYKRVYVVTSTNANTGQLSTQSVTKYYANVSYWNRIKAQGKGLPKKWNGEAVEQNFVIQHTTVNKQVGWRWGVPDIMPVVFWAKAYKEYLEDNAMLVKAYSRLAWQIKASTPGAAGAAASQMLVPPTRDYLTGELRATGGTTVTGQGTSINPITPTGSSVDFSKGVALASAIAAGLEVSLTVLTSDGSQSNAGGAQALDLPTLKAMEFRQNLHSERFLEIFEFWGATIYDSTPSNGEADTQEDKPVAKPLTIAMVTWPQIETDTTKDRMTAIGTAVELGILYKQEARKEIIGVLGIAPYKPWDELPMLADDPAAQESQDNAAAMQQQIAVTNGVGQVTDTSKPPVVAKQGVSGGVAAKGGAQTSANSARKARTKDTNNS